MRPFAYERAHAPEEAIRLVARQPATRFLAGGTNLYDLMKAGVESPSTLIDINRLDMSDVIQNEDGTVRIGAMVRNAALANHPIIKTGYPLISQALLSGASPQLRNMASTGGNILQRTRCYYFADASFPACNKRMPGSGCGALVGFNRIHAILGQSDKGSTNPESCIAANPSDMCVAMAALGATIELQGPKGKRLIRITDFHRLPGSTPWIDTVLQPDELILAVTLPPARFDKHAYYLKARDRRSYAFGLVTVAAGLEMSNGVVTSACLALGDVASKPWRVPEAEEVLVNKTATIESFRRAADILLSGAQGYEHNSFKIELAKQGVVRALTLAVRGVGYEEGDA